jgi:hypothetical protein
MGTSSSWVLERSPLACLINVGRTSILTVFTKSLWFSFILRPDPVSPWRSGK